MTPSALLITARNATINAEVEPVFCDKLHTQNLGKYTPIPPKMHSMEDLGSIFKVCESYSLDGILNMQDANLMSSLLTVGVASTTASTVSTALSAAVQASASHIASTKSTSRKQLSSTTSTTTANVPSTSSSIPTTVSTAVGPTHVAPVITSTPTNEKVTRGAAISGPSPSSSPAPTTPSADELTRQWIITDEEKAKYLQW
jgi:hypothetical protein